MGPALAREGRVVPKDAVAAAGDQKGHSVGSIVLPEIEIVALDVEQPELVFSQAIQRLIGIRLPLLLHVERLLALYLGGRNDAAAVLLRENGLARGIKEADRARSEIDTDRKPRGGDRRQLGVAGKSPNGERTLRRQDSYLTPPKPPDMSAPDVSPCTTYAGIRDIGSWVDKGEGFGGPKTQRGLC